MLHVDATKSLGILQLSSLASTQILLFNRENRMITRILVLFTVHFFRREFSAILWNLSLEYVMPLFPQLKQRKEEEEEQANG